MQLRNLSPFLFLLKILILTFEEFNNKFNNDNALSDIRIRDIGKDISLTPIEMVMRDQTPDNTSEPNVNITVNLHPTDGTHWVLVIRREGAQKYYFDSLNKNLWTSRRKEVRTRVRQFRFRKKSGDCCSSG